MFPAYWSTIWILKVLQLKAKQEMKNIVFDEYEFEQALGIGDGQGSLACCSPWDLKESDTTE